MLRHFLKSAPAITRLSSAQSLRPAFIITRNMSGHPNKEFEASSLFDCSKITAVVTGGGTGIGLMITQALVANGAKVYITGRREEALDNIVKKYQTGPGSIVAYVLQLFMNSQLTYTSSMPGDVSDKEDVKRLADEMSEKEPNGIQLLVNNAGIARDDNTGFSANGQPDMSDAAAISKHFMNSEPQQWADTFKTNVTAGFFMSMAFLPLLERGTSVIKPDGFTSSVVNVSSISGAMKGSSNGQFSYAASKASFTHVSRMLATTFAETSVRVNIIAPGIFPSEMTAGESDEHNKSKLDEGSSNPAGRKGRDSDMGATILLLATKAGAFYNHQIMYPDGGNTLSVPAAV